MSTTPVQVLLQIMVDTKGMVQSIKQVKALDQEIGKVAKSAAATTKQTAAATNELAASTKKVAAAGKDRSKAEREAAKYSKAAGSTVKQLTTDHNLLNMAWREGSNVVDRTYLRSITGMRKAFRQFNDEAQRTLVYNGKTVKTLADSEYRMERFYMKGNLLTRGLHNMATNMQNLGKNTQWTGRQMMVGITAPVAAVGALSMRSAMEIGQLDLALQKVMANASKSDMEKLDKQTRRLSEAFGVARTEIKAVQTEFARVGFDIKTIENATEQVQELSSVGDVDTTAAQELIRVLYQSGMAYEEVQSQLEKLNLMDDVTNLSLKELIGSLKDVYPTAKRFGNSVSEVAALMTGITQGGFSAGEAATSLNNVLVKLPTALANIESGASGGKARLKDLQDQLKNLNARTGMDLSLYKDDGELKSGVDLLSSLAAALNEVKKQDKGGYASYLQALRAAFQTEGMPEGSQLIESLAKSMDVATASGQDLAKALGIAQGTYGDTAEAWARQLGAVKDADVTKVAGNIQKVINAGQDLGKKLLPYAVKALEKLNELVDAFENMGDVAKNALLGIIGGFALLGPVVYAFGQGIVAISTVFKGAIAPAKQLFSMYTEWMNKAKGNDLIRSLNEDLNVEIDKPESERDNAKIGKLLQQIKDVKAGRIDAALASAEAIEEEAEAERELAAARAESAAAGEMASASSGERAAASTAAAVETNAAEAVTEGTPGRTPTKIEQNNPGFIDRWVQERVEKRKKQLVEEKEKELLDEDIAARRRRSIPLEAPVVELDEAQKKLNAAQEAVDALNDSAILDLAEKEAKDAVSTMESTGFGLEQIFRGLAEAKIPVPIQPDFGIEDVAERTADYERRYASFRQRLLDSVFSLEDPERMFKASLAEFKAGQPELLHDIISKSLNPPVDRPSTTLQDSPDRGMQREVRFDKSGKRRDREYSLRKRSINNTVEEMLTASSEMGEGPQVLTPDVVKGMMKDMSAGPRTSFNKDFEKRFNRAIMDALRSGNTEEWIAQNSQLFETGGDFEGLKQAIISNVEATKKSLMGRKGADLFASLDDVERKIADVSSLVTEEDKNAAFASSNFRTRLAELIKERNNTKGKGSGERRKELNAQIKDLRSRLASLKDGDARATAALDELKSLREERDRITDEISRNLIPGVRRDSTGELTSSLGPADSGKRVPNKTLPMGKSALTGLNDKATADTLSREFNRDGANEAKGGAAIDRIFGSARIKAPEPVTLDFGDADLEALEELIQIPQLSEQDLADIDLSDPNLSKEERARRQTKKARLEKRVQLGRENAERQNPEIEKRNAARRKANRAKLENALKSATQKLDVPSEADTASFLENWIAEAFDSGDPAEYARRNGVPMEIRDTLSAALFRPNVERGRSDTGKGDNGKSVGYRGMLREALGKGERSTGEDKGVAVIERLASSILGEVDAEGNFQPGFKGATRQVKKRFDDLASGIEAEIAGFGPGIPDFKGKLGGAMSTAGAGGRGVEEIVDDLMREAGRVVQDREGKIKSVESNARGLRSRLRELEKSRAKVIENAKAAGARKATISDVEALPQAIKDQIKGMSRDEKINFLNEFTRKQREDNIATAIKDAEDNLEERRRVIQRDLDRQNGILNTLRRDRDAARSAQDKLNERAKEIFEGGGQPAQPRRGGRFAKRGTPEADFGVLEAAMEPELDDRGRTRVLRYGGMDPKTGQIRKAIPKRQLSKLTGSLTPEASNALHEMIVTNVFDGVNKSAETFLDEAGNVREISSSTKDAVAVARNNSQTAMQVVRKYFPDLSEDLQKEYADQLLQVADAVRLQMDEARYFVGEVVGSDNMTPSQRESARIGRRGKAVAGSSKVGKIEEIPASLEGLGEGATAPESSTTSSYNPLSFDEKINEDARRASGSRSSSREESMIDDLLTGFGTVEQPTVDVEAQKLTKSAVAAHEESVKRAWKAIDDAKLDMDAADKEIQAAKDRLAELAVRAQGGYDPSIEKSMRRAQSRIVQATTNKATAQNTIDVNRRRISSLTSEAAVPADLDMSARQATPGQIKASAHQKKVRDVGNKIKGLQDKIAGIDADILSESDALVAAVDAEDVDEAEKIYQRIIKLEKDKEESSKVLERSRNRLATLNSDKVLGRIDKELESEMRAKEGEVKAKKDSVYKAKRQVKTFDDELEKIEEQRAANESTKERIRRERAQRRLRKQRAEAEKNLKQAQAELSDLQSKPTSKLSVIDSETGDAVEYDTYDEYRAARRQQAANLVDAIDTSDIEAEERDKVLRELDSKLGRTEDLTEEARGRARDIKAAEDELADVVSSIADSDIDIDSSDGIDASIDMPGDGTNRRRNRRIDRRSGRAGTRRGKIKRRILESVGYSYDAGDTLLSGRDKRSAGRQAADVVRKPVSRLKESIASTKLTGEYTKGKGGFLNPKNLVNMLNPLKSLSKEGTKATGIFSRLMNVGKGGAGSGGLAMLFEGAGPMASMVVAAGPVLLIIAAIAAAVAVLAMNFGKWRDTASKGIDKIKAAGKGLIDAVIKPFKGLFKTLGGEGEKGGSKIGGMWNNVGKILGKVFEIIAKVITIITPIVSVIIKMITTTIYIVVQTFRAVVALITGDWEDLGDALMSIWEATWYYIKWVLGQGAVSILRVLAMPFKGAINLVQKLANAIRNFPGVPGFVGDIADGLAGLNSGIDDFIENGAAAMDEWVGDDPATHYEEGKESGESFKDGVEEGASTAVVPPPEFVTGDEAEAGREAAGNFMSAFQDKMRGVVDGWKEAALDAYDQYAKGITDAIDAKIKKIDEEVEAERKRDEDLEYLARKEELRNNRKNALQKYQASYDAAVYSGNYDEAKQLTIDKDQEMQGFDKEDADIEKDRNRTLTERFREDRKKQLEIEKDAAQKMIDIRREQLQTQLDAMTEYIPKNVAEAQRMHGAIQGKMLEFTNGYGMIGAAQAANWGKGWSDAFAAAKKQVAEEAYWTGDAALQFFAAGLGVDVEASKNPYYEQAKAQQTSSGIPTMGGPWNVVTLEKAAGKDLNGDGVVGGEFHTGGHVGPKSGNAYDVPATLQAGEYVIKRSSVQRLGTGFLDTVNKGEVPDVPKYHTGGLVHNIVHSAAGKAMRNAYKNWMADKTKINIKGAKYSASDYKAALSNAATTMPTTDGTETTAPGNTAAVGEAAPGEYASGLNRILVARFNQWNAALGGKFRIGSGFRTMAEQAVLYDKWLRRVPGQAQAAPPGRSNHNFGLAIDLRPSSTTAAERSLGARFGLRWPMSYEPWHVEPVEARAWREIMKRGGTVPSGQSTGLVLRAGVVAGTGEGGNANVATPAGPMARILKTIRTLESGGNYGIKSRYSTASGAYQFLDGTWNNYGGYARAADAPPAVQDARAAADVQRFLNMYKNDLRAVPGNWYSPATFRSGEWDRPMGKGNPLTMREYINRWLGTYNSLKEWHEGGLIPAMASGGYVFEDGIAQVHQGETVLTKKLTDAMSSGNVGGGSVEIHNHFEGGFFGTDRELEKFQMKMEREIIPKIQKARGVEKMTFKGVTR